MLVMITGCYIFMGLAEDLTLYLQFTMISILGCWLIFIIPLAFDLVVFSFEHGRGGGWPRKGVVGQKTYSEMGMPLTASLTICGAVVLGLGLLTMGFPLTARDVPTPLSWLASGLPLQTVFSAMMINQVGSLPDGDSILKKSGFVPHGNFVISIAISIGYLIIAVYVFLLQNPEPESGPSTRLMGHVLDSFLQSVEKGISLVGRIGGRSTTSVSHVSNINAP